MAVGVEEGIAAPDVQRQRPRSDRADVCGVGQNVLHPRIGGKGLALFDPDRGEQAQRGRVRPFGGFFLDHLVQQFPEPVIRGHHEVGGKARGIDQCRGLRAVLFGEGVDLEGVPDALDRRGGLAIHQEGPEHDPVPVGRGPDHDEAFGHLAGIPRRQDQVFAARALVGAGDAHVHHPFVPEIIDRPQHLGRNFHHDGAVLGVDPDEAVDRVVIGGQFHRARIDKVFPDHIGLVDGSEFQQAVAHAGLVHDGDRQQIGLQRARPIQIVPDLRRGFGGREAVGQRQRADGAFHPVGRDDPRCDFGGHLEGLGHGRKRRDRDEKAEDDLCGTGQNSVRHDEIPWLDSLPTGG